MMGETNGFSLEREGKVSAEERKKSLLPHEVACDKGKEGLSGRRRRWRRRTTGTPAFGVSKLELGDRFDGCSHRR